ncbi:MAG TPA: response regulator [Gammaproteobacteria bacterium]|jgi:two-component system chemotaxis sensor kinase CheA|nr:response regulator [Gammaproteobacteria bacterium]
MPFNPELMKQLLATFQAELEEGANTLINGLVDLEKHSNIPEKRAEDIESIFRTAHNLKGAARGLGISAVGDIAHNIETVFSKLKSDNTPISKNTIDICMEAVDKMLMAMSSFTNNQPLEFDIENLNRRILDDSIDSSEDKDKTLSAPVPSVKTQDADAVAKPSPANLTDQMETNKKTAGSDTVRVQIKTIDKLSELSEEIQSSKIELDDYCGYVKHLDKSIQDFQESWKDMSSEIESSVNIGEGSRLQKIITRANDELLGIMSAMHKIRNDIISQTNDYARLSTSIQGEVAMLRLVPANSLLTLMPRYVRELSTELGKQAELVMNGGDVYIDKYVLDGLKDPFIHLLRNAIDHGIEDIETRKKNNKPLAGTISINFKDAGSKILIEISDDGGGIDYNAIKSKVKTAKHDEDDNIDALTNDQLQSFLFKSGFSTKDNITNISGRGVGLDVVKKNVQVLKGTINIESTPGKGTKFIISVPLSISSERGLIVRIEDEVFVLPTANIDRVLSIKREDIVSIEGGHAVLIEGHPVVIKSLATVLNLQNHVTNDDIVNIVVLSVSRYMVALAVDHILGEREIVIKAIQDPLANISCVSGATLLDRNKIAIVLDPDELMKLSIHTESQYQVVEDAGKDKKKESLRVLVVDDSITTRTLEKNILESKGYHVTTAVNGQEGWDIIQKQPFALIITDINMPIMNGFELTEKIKRNDKYSKLPVIIVTSLGSDAEKARGIDAGADAYIVKSEFESGTLLQIIDQLI